MMIATKLLRLTLLPAALLTLGCAVTKPANLDTPSVVATQLGEPSAVRQVVALDEDTASNAISLSYDEVLASPNSLFDLERQSNQNPTLCRRWREYQSARSRVRYIAELPDPQIAANLFGQPIETAAGSQRANLKVSQMLPWLPRLDAMAKQACFEAAALGQVYESERLKTVSDIRAHWYRLYVLQKQIEINTANQVLLESLIGVANARVSTGKASQGDVLAGTLEFSKLEEQNVTLRQQLVSTKSKINRLVGRDADSPIAGASELAIRLPEWDQALLRSLAWSHQPEMEAARIRSQATRWGVEVARLKRRPDFTLNASWFAIDDNRPTPSIVDVGQDAWSVGAMMTVPIRREKYDAIEQEALWRHAASSSSIEEVRQHYDSLLVDLWEQARAADETAGLYQDTIIPEARRTLAADQEAYTNGKVEFDRVVRDFRNLLTLELGYHRSLGQLATALARIRQATGGCL